MVTWARAALECRLVRLFCETVGPVLLAETLQYELVLLQRGLCVVLLQQQM